MHVGCRPNQTVLQLFAEDAQTPERWPHEKHERMLRTSSIAWLKKNYESLSTTSRNSIQHMSIPRHASTQRGSASPLARVLSESVLDQNDRDPESFPARHALP